MPVPRAFGREEVGGHPTHLPTAPIQRKDQRLLSVPQFTAYPDTPCPAMSVLGPKLVAGNFARWPCHLAISGNISPFPGAFMKPQLPSSSDGEDREEAGSSV